MFINIPKHGGILRENGELWVAPTAPEVHEQKGRCSLMNRYAPMTRKAFKRFAAFLAVALIFGVVGGTVGLGLAEAEPESPSQAVGYEAIYTQNNPVVKIAKEVRPAVVQVINMVQTWNRGSGEVETQDQAYGSGVYIDERGYIVTNYHVIENADAVDIMLEDGTRMEAEITGYDSSTDIAVLKASKPLNATPVVMGDSDALQVGELAIAIGNPGAGTSVLTGTVTAGIISALDRSTVGAQAFARSVNVIQTDAAINSGNSGGALLNGKGELIGIPTLKISVGYGVVYEGLGFAIPVNTVKPIVEQLIEKGKVVRPRLGVGIQGDWEGPEEALRGYPPAGVLIGLVEENSPAQKAGIKQYDIITHIDGVRVKTYVALTAELDKHQAGDVVKVGIYRPTVGSDGSIRGMGETLEMDVELSLLD